MGIKKITVTEKTSWLYFTSPEQVPDNITFEFSQNLFSSRQYDADTNTVNWVATQASSIDMYSVDIDVSTYILATHELLDVSWSILVPDTRASVRLPMLPGAVSEWAQGFNHPDKEKEITVRAYESSLTNDYSALAGGLLSQGGGILYSENNSLKSIETTIDAAGAVPKQQSK